MFHSLLLVQLFLQIPTIF